MTDQLPPLPEPFSYFYMDGDTGRWTEYRRRPINGSEEEPLFDADQMRAYAQEAARQEREAILAAVDDLEEPAWYGYENPNNFDDGKRAAMTAIRARGQK